jgi:hypothetical protein
MALLDTRDAQVCLWQDGSVVRSPGFVLLDGGEYSFGDSALAQARLRPRDINNRFWWQLGTQPLNPALGTARHTADLAHAHLQALHREAGAPPAMALAVPDSMPHEQLSLLLGIVQACDFSAVGLVSRSVLLASGSGVNERCLHVELQLHQGVINELVPTDGKLALQHSTPLPACGLLALQERCVSAIAGSFIQQTRFDPRRRADSEQALYNQLPQILETLAERGECSVDIDGHRCRVVASSLAAVTERLSEALQQVLSGNSLPVLMDRQLHLLAGSSSLPGDKQILADDTLWRAYQQHESSIHSEGDGLHLVDRLPLGKAATTAVNTPAATPATTAGAAVPTTDSAGHARATHVLVGVRARPLKGDRVDLGEAHFLQRKGEQWTLHGEDALINGLPSNSRQALALGDTLSLGSAGHGRLIEIVD